MSIVNYFLLCLPAFEPHFHSIKHYVQKLMPPARKEAQQLQPVPSIFFFYPEINLFQFSNIY